MEGAYTKPLRQCQLYTFIDTAYLQGRSPAELARQLCAGGSDLIQLRAKELLPSDLLPIALELRGITASAGVGLVINDHPQLAMDVGADCCHLGQEDFFEMGWTDAAQLRLGAVQLGLSSHAPSQAERAEAAGADYIAVGPVYPTPTKPGAQPVTLDYVRWARQHVRVPWFAIGGIQLANLEEVLEAGARRICVVSAILNQQNVAKACQEFRKRLPSSLLENA